MKKWFSLFSLSLGATIVLMLPYLRQIYYEPMREALGMTNMEFGMTMSAYGLTAVICYFPGGWLADRIHPKYLLSLSLLLTGCSGLYFATFPGLWGTMAVHVFWGISSVLTFWAALLKTVRMLGEPGEQGRLFGFLESFRGITSTISGGAALWLFGLYVNESAGLTAVILFYSGASILMAPVLWMLLRRQTFKKSEESVMGDIKKVLGMPNVWLIAFIIFCAYTAYAGITYFTPYMQKVYGMSASMAGILAIIRTYVLQMAGGPLGGFISDKSGSVIKVLRTGFLVMILLTALLVLIPSSPAYLFAVLLVILLLVTVIFAMRGIYFAAFDEARVPLRLTGAAAGFASCVGYIPDVFVPVLFGSFLDRFAGETGYMMIFGFIAAASAAGFILCLLFMKRNARSKASAESAECVKQDQPMEGLR